MNNGHAGLVQLSRPLDAFGVFVLDGLGVGQPDVGEEERDDESGGGYAHPGDDEHSLGLVVGSSDGHTLGRTRRIAEDELGRVCISLRGQGRVGKVSLELVGYFVGPDSCARRSKSEI